MAAYSPTAEYGTVIRLEGLHHSPPSHDFVGETEPLHVRQFCRTMTLAQGRVLYDVWERSSWRERRLGYLVPSHLAIEARKISGSEHWKNLPPLDSSRFECAWEAVVAAWPRMPVFGVGRVVERLVRLGLGGRRLVVEEAVVRYARRNWTSYWLRIGTGSVADEDTEERTCEAVAERLRQVLRAWMAADAEPLYVQSVFERHGLVAEKEKTWPWETSQGTRFC